jgi:hypothetical protein
VLGGKGFFNGDESRFIRDKIRLSRANPAPVPAQAREASAAAPEPIKFRRFMFKGGMENSFPFTHFALIAVKYKLRN